MILGLLLGIVGTSLVFAGILGLCLAASRRDDFENGDELSIDEEMRLTALPVLDASGFGPGDRVIVGKAGKHPEFLDIGASQLARSDLSYPAWINGGDEAA